jgi:uncharacterized protein (TIGR03382 family)
MNKGFVAALTASVVAGSAMATGNTIFYGGNFDGTNGGAAQQDAFISSAIYDDVNIPAGPAQIITGYGSENLMTAAGQAQQGIRLWVEVRQGVSEGNGGAVIIAGHELAVTSRQNTGRSGFGLTEQQFLAADAAGDVLAPGTYHLAVSLVDPDANGQMGFVSVTSGANGVGGPLNNNNSFWNSSTFGFNYTDSQNVLGAGNGDLAYILQGKDIPAPGAIALLGLAGLAARRRRRA